MIHMNEAPMITVNGRGLSRPIGRYIDRPEPVVLWLIEIAHYGDITLCAVTEEAGTVHGYHAFQGTVDWRTRIWESNEQDERPQERAGFEAFMARVMAEVGIPFALIYTGGGHIRLTLYDTYAQALNALRRHYDEETETTVEIWGSDAPKVPASKTLGMSDLANWYAAGDRGYHVVIVPAAKG